MTPTTSWYQISEGWLFSIVAIVLSLGSLFALFWLLGYTSVQSAGQVYLGGSAGLDTTPVFVVPPLVFLKPLPDVFEDEVVCPAGGDCAAPEEISSSTSATTASEDLGATSSKVSPISSSRRSACSWVSR